MSQDSNEQMLSRIRDAGVVGAGGAGFPTHVKYKADVDVVIANGAECEPLIRADQQEMEHRAGELLRGLQIAVQLTGAKRGVIGLKSKYSAAIAALEEQIALKRLGDRFGLFLLDNFYPAGDEFVLVREVLGKSIPEFGLPLDVGAVVSNVCTLIDVAAAVDSSRPVTERLVTVAGEVVRPGSFRVPVGTPLSSLVQAASGPRIEAVRWIAGGPMMGNLVEDQDQPVTKVTNSVLVLPESHPVIRRRLTDIKRQVHLTRSACLKCMICTEVCPRNALGHRLYPDRLMRNVAAGVAEDMDAFTGAFLCSECGLCTAYGCVMNLDPAYMNRELKSKLSAAGVERPEPAETQERVFGAKRRVPTMRLIARLGLSQYDLPAPLSEFDVPLRRLSVPLKQHLGAPALAVVKAGQKVAAGELLGEIPEGKLGARVHASAPGTVSAVTDGLVVIEME